MVAILNLTRGSCSGNCGSDLDDGDEAGVGVASSDVHAASPVTIDTIIPNANRIVNMFLLFISLLHKNWFFD